MFHNRTLFLDHKDVRIFHAWKSGRALSYTYALEANVNAETNDKPCFDVRQLPSRYTHNLIIEDISAPLNNEDFEAKYKNKREAHRESMRRAIDDGYDFVKPSSEGKLKSIFSTIFNR
jgi:hypothetical protein